MWLSSRAPAREPKAGITENVEVSTGSGSLVSLGMTTAQKKTARTPREGNAGRFASWLAGDGGFTPPFFFRRRSLTERLRFDLWSSCFDSQMACDLLVHQFERCRSAESRISLLRGTSLRYCDVDETRDWSRHTKRKTINSRLGDDSIWSDSGTRKSQISYPQP
jgi:hypothetical protein